MKHLAKLVVAVFGLCFVLIALGIRADRPAAEVEARRASAPSKFIEVDGLRVHYRDRGSGPAMVLLHGSNSSLFTWEGWTAQLISDHRVIALDLPGHGLTGPDIRARYSPRAMAEVVDAFVAKLGVARFVLAGNSMGGGVAWNYTLAHPQKVEQLILVDSHGWPREEPRPFGFRMYATPILGSLARWFTPRFLIARSVRDTYGEPARVTPALIDTYEDFLLRDGNREATRQRFLLPPDNAASARIGEIRAPTLILWGGRDRWILPKYAQRFAGAIAGSQLVVFDALGHIPMEEDPATTVAVVRSFLQSKSPAF